MFTAREIVDYANENKLILVRESEITPLGRGYYSNEVCARHCICDMLGESRYFNYTNPPKKLNISEREFRGIEAGFEGWPREEEDDEYYDLGVEIYTLSREN